jgi:hypothetical protein
MALVQFKRINPNPPPTEAEMVEVAQRMLLYLMSHPEEADELLEPESPLPPATEFVDSQCPECRGWRLGHAPNPSVTDRSDPACVVPKSGHYANCSRWRKYWEYIDCRTLADGQQVLYRRGE